MLVRGGTAGGLAPLPEGRVAFTLQTLASPPEVHLVDRDGGAPRRLTRFTAPVMDRVSLGVQEVVSYRLTSPERESRLVTYNDYVALANAIAPERRVLRRRHRGRKARPRPASCRRSTRSRSTAR